MPNKSHLVSIIIPTYNRSNLIGGSLDSIIAQTNQSWECIVVDDCSTDYTEELLLFYCARDSRIRYVKRPPHLKRGANVCRNYGFELSKGKYIQWFDSDDLMLPTFLEDKAKVLDAHPVDFVISKAVNFRDPDPEDITNHNEYHYRFERFAINHHNYLVQNINWLTYDFMCRRYLAEKVKFNENLNSAQERNFFTKITCFSTNAFLLEKYLTKRRIHGISIQAKLDGEAQLRRKSELEFFYYTWQDLSEIKQCKSSLSYLFEEAVRRSFIVDPSKKMMINLTLGFFKNSEFKPGLWFLLYHVSMKLFGRGIIFRDRFREASIILRPSEEKL